MQYAWNGNQVMDEIHARIVQQMNDIGRQVVDIAQRYAPRRTGRLATGISYAYNDATYTVAFIASAPYSVFVEYGTRNMRPQPYLRPALNTVGSIYGIDLALAFTNTPAINQPILAHGAGFHLPPTLTHAQRQHVARHLVPTSQRHHIANVSRARLYVRRHHRP
jgi:HK97 gp10 family phage protein